MAGLASHDCVGFASRRGAVRPWTFRGGTFEPRGPLAIDLGVALVEAALGGVGIAQVLDFMVEGELKDGRLVEVLRDEAAPGPRIHLVYPAGRLLPRVRAFVDLLVTDLR